MLIAVPHAGRAYPPALLGHLRHPAEAMLRLEDRLVDQVATAVGQATGAALLVAHAPRAMIDLNRAIDDLDPDMIQPIGPDAGHRGLPRLEAASLPGRRARSGLGLIPRRLPGLGELWRGRIDRTELVNRVESVHQPYHAALAGALQQLRARWGAALLLDLHSMPPLPRPTGGAQPAAFVLGDRFGASCCGQLVATAFDWLGRSGQAVAHNRPYAGGYVLERHADPRGNIHAIQLEIDRSRYLDSRFAELGDGFAATVDLLTGLVRSLAAEVARIGQPSLSGPWREAAE